MDGLARSNDLVFILAASNLPWYINNYCLFIYLLITRDLDYAMLRRLEKRILVQLPTETARESMFRHHLPSVLTNDPITISSNVEYDRAAKVWTH